jgi:hypothetical protein
MIDKACDIWHSSSIMTPEKSILEEYKSQKKDEQVMARVSAQLKEDAQEKCQRVGVPLSFIIERALKDWIESDSTN